MAIKWKPLTLLTGRKLKGNREFDGHLSFIFRSRGETFGLEQHVFLLEQLSQQRNKLARTPLNPLIIYYFLFIF